MTFAELKFTLEKWVTAEFDVGVFIYIYICVCVCVCATMLFEWDTSIYSAYLFSNAFSDVIRSKLC